MILFYAINGYKVTNVNCTFDGCDFDTVTLGENISGISSSSFNKVTTLKNIYVSTDNKSFMSDNGVLYTKNKEKLIKYPPAKIDESYVVLDTVTTIQSYAFNYAKTKSVILPDTLTNIAANAFSNSLLETVRIPENVTSIGYGAFSNCRNLKSVYYDATYCSTTTFFLATTVFPSSVESFIIGNKVEYLPGYLLKNAIVSEIVIPPSVTSINSNALNGFNNLTIKAYTNSCAREYADTKGYAFVSITCGNCRCDDWQIITDASCTEEGTKTGICDVCGAAIEGTVPTKNHNYVSVITAPSCTSDGYTTHTCSVCGYTYTDSAVTALGHSFTNYVSNNDATCTADGTKTAKCDRCDVTDTIADAGSKLDHTPATAVEENRVEATCTADGSYDSVVYCSVCDTELSRDAKTTDALGHSFTNYVSNNDATCTADGTKTAKCDRCDVTNAVTEEGSAKGHTVVIDKAVAPACTETGLTEGKHCSVCNTVLVKQEVIPATGHNDNNSDGICDSCGDDLGTHTPSENCTCICHKGGFMGFIYKIIRIFWKIFGTNKACACGAAHY